MSFSSLALRVSLAASFLSLAACQAAPVDSQYQKREASKLNAELSQELEDEREREKQAQQ